MNVVHVNASDGHGGAGRACFRLHQALQQHGVRSRVLVQRKYSVDPAVEMVDLSMADTELIRHADLIQRIFASQNRTDISNTHFSISLVGSDLSAHPAVEEAEIIHLHWVASMQTPANLRQLINLIQLHKVRLDLARSHQVNPGQQHAVNVKQRLHPPRSFLVE